MEQDVCSFAGSWAHHSSSTLSPSAGLRPFLCPSVLIADAALLGVIGWECPECRVEFSNRLTVRSPRSYWWHVQNQLCYWGDLHFAFCILYLHFGIIFLPRVCANQNKAQLRHWNCFDVATHQVCTWGNSNDWVAWIRSLQFVVWDL